MRHSRMHAPPVLLGLVAVIVAIELFSTLESRIRWNLIVLGAFEGGTMPALLNDPAMHLGLVPTLFTHALLHGGVLHAGFNSLLLVHLGTPVAQRMGAVRFLVFFAGTAAAGAAVHSLLFQPEAGYMVGASGAVFGVAAARANILADEQFLRGIARLRYLAGQAVGWMVANAAIYTMMLLLAMGGGMGGLVAWKAHLGGYVGGALLGPVLLRSSARQVRR